jgi:hypothetical protein
MEHERLPLNQNNAAPAPACEKNFDSGSNHFPIVFQTKYQHFHHGFIKFFLCFYVINNYKKAILSNGGSATLIRNT